MKIVLILLALFLAFIGVALIYSTLHAKQNGFGATPMRKFFVDRHGVSGYVHQSGESVILTRRDPANPHYYMVALNGQSAFVTECRDWHAPSLLVFPMGYGSCFPSDLIDAEFDNERPESPAGRAKIAGAALEFHTNNGKLIRVTR